MVVARLLSVFIVLVTLAAATPRPPSPAYAAPASGGAFTGVWTVGPDKAEGALLDDLGAGWARVTVPWNTIEPSNGTFVWSTLDQQMAAASGGGKRTVLALVREVPPWAAASSCTLTNASEWQQLASFTGALAKRYKGVVWQFFNEEDNTNAAFDAQFSLGGCFGTASVGMPTSAGRINYAHALEAAAAAVRAADPTAQIAAGGVASGQFVSPSGGRFDQGFLPGVMAQLSADNSLGSLDYLAVHYFSSQAATFVPTGTDLVGRVNQLRQDILGAGLTADQLKPVIADELSYTDTIGTSTGDANNPFNIGQRAYVSKVFARSAAAGVRAAIWFQMGDDASALGSDNAYGLRARGGVPKPSYAAVRYFNSIIKSASQFAGTLSLGNVSPKLEGYEFTSASGYLVQIVWNQLDSSQVGYTPTGAIVGVTDSGGASIAFGGNSVSVGAEPRFITYIPGPFVTGAPVGFAPPVVSGVAPSPTLSSVAPLPTVSVGPTLATLPTPAVAPTQSSVGPPNSATQSSQRSDVVIATLASPVRLVDSRLLGDPIPPGGSRCFQAGGVGGVPADASAVVLNLTAVGYSTNGWLTVYPNGQVVPPSSTLNFGNDAYAIDNGSVTSVGEGGQICVSVGTLDGSSGGSHVIVDATGYLPNGVQSQLAMLPFPLRVVDTRASNAPITAGSSQCFQIAGLAGIPFGAAAVILNVTATGYASNGWLTVFPNGQPLPATSTLNFDQSEYAMANNAIVRIGDGGQVCVNVGTLNSAPGASQVMLDAVGYLTPSGMAKVVMLSSPERVMDSRITDAGLVAAGSTRCFAVGGVADIPDSATGVAVNLTAVGYNAQGWLTAFPDGQPLPGTSSLNFDPSEYALANAAIVGLGGNGQLCVNVGTLNGVPGSSHFIVDVVGYLSP